MYWSLHGIVSYCPLAPSARKWSIAPSLFSSNSLSMGIVASGDHSETVSKHILRLAKDLSKSPAPLNDPWLKQLNWTPVQHMPMDSSEQKASKPPKLLWPKWYWDLARPRKDFTPGTVDLTPRTRIAPLLLRLSWQGWPLFHSREHGWTYCVSPGTAFKTRQAPLDFHHPTDEVLQALVLHEGFVFYKLRHKDGESANVGSPLAKTFVKYAQDGTLTSPGDEARSALDMNAQCSYWISARDRVMKQMVVWQHPGLDMGLSIGAAPGSKAGIILPQVITMGTVTRRAIERTWLTASNAKENRVGSELKAMVRAPPGYALVGADVDSEELWISSAMGDAQFGLHGATALGWMTLEGTKAAGTDLHSKTASILGLSRDQAKVFNYSRIYGAGMRHAVQLLLQANTDMLPEQAQRLAEQLYASTKGKNTHRTDVFGRKFWFGGTESFVFNKLEEIALSEHPTTPALGCGITHALSKKYLPAAFGSDYMTSRINWVVQSSGVDYLHLLIVAMDHLIQTYAIDARYLLSVHDELRYLFAERDRYRAALVLQVANLWTRSLFAFRLGMDDLPQGVAFFSAVDVDHVLRKETDMPCVTPSQPSPIPPGESLTIEQILTLTGGGSLWADGRAMMEEEPALDPLVLGYEPPDCMGHRADSAAWLRAQATNSFAEVKYLAQESSGVRFEGEVGRGRGGGARMRGRRRNDGEVPEPVTEKTSEWAEVLQQEAETLGSEDLFLSLIGFPVTRATYS
jgi:DNA polymerase gamma 1